MAARLLAKKFEVMRMRGAALTGSPLLYKTMSTSAVVTTQGEGDGGRGGGGQVVESPPRRPPRPRKRRWNPAPLGLSDLWDPFSVTRTWSQMMEGVNRLLEEFDPARSLRESVENFRPAYDLMEDETSYKLRLDMPGLSKDELKVAVEDGTLVIRGEHSEEEKAANWSARSLGSYNTRIVLPENARLDGITAQMKNGVLQVIVPKIESQSKQEVIDVEVG